MIGDELFYSEFSMSDFILSEGVRLRTNTRYGTNPEFNDNRGKSVQILPSIRTDFSTVVKLGDELFVIDCVGQNFSFRSSKKPADSPVDEILRSASISKRKLDADLPYSKAVSVFGSILSVMLMIAEQNGLSRFYFRGYSPALDSLYSTGLRNRYLMNDLSLLGWRVEKDGEIYAVTK